MKPQIQCCVCDYPDVIDDRCPNCETDLSLVRTLMNLPRTSSPSLSNGRLVLIICLVILLVLGGIELFIGSISLHQSSVPLKVTISRAEDLLLLTSEKRSQWLAEIASTDQNLMSCGGFNYTIRQNDTLFKLSNVFYGDDIFWNYILAVNPALKDRFNQLNIGETVFIPNRKDQCLTR